MGYLACPLELCARAGGFFQCHWGYPSRSLRLCAGRGFSSTRWGYPSYLCVGMGWVCAIPDRGWSARRRVLLLRQPVGADFDRGGRVGPPVGGALFPHWPAGLRPQWGMPGMSFAGGCCSPVDVVPPAICFIAVWRIMCRVVAGMLKAFRWEEVAGGRSLGPKTDSGKRPGFRLKKGVSRGSEPGTRMKHDRLPRIAGGCVSVC